VSAAGVTVLATDTKVAVLETRVIAANITVAPFNTTVSAPDTIVLAAKCIDIRLGILNKSP